MPKEKKNGLEINKVKTKRARQRKQPSHEWFVIVDLNAIIREASEMQMWMSERPNRDENSSRIGAQICKLNSCIECFQRHSKKLLADCELER